MRKLSFFAGCLFVLSLVTMLTTVRAGSQQARALVNLQSASPGTVQSGNTNVSGRLIAESFRPGSHGVRFADGSKQVTAGGGMPMGSFVLSESTTPPPGYAFTGASLPATATEWTPGVPLPVATYGHGAVWLGGHIYVIGGRTDHATAVSTVFRFDPDSQTWTTITPLATARTDAAVATDGQRIFAFGGLGVNGLALASCETYDPSTSRWTAIAPIQPEGRAGMFALPTPQAIYLFGGEDRPKSQLAVWSTYDTHINQWLPDRKLPFAHSYFGGGFRDDDIWLDGGFSGVEGGDWESRWSWMTLTNSRWSPSWFSSMRDTSHFASVSYRNDIYLFGGRRGPFFLSSTWKVQHTYDRENLAPLPGGGRSDFPVIVDDDGRMTAIGGLGPTGPLCRVDSLQLKDLFLHRRSPD